MKNRFSKKEFLVKRKLVVSILILAALLVMPLAFANANPPNKLPDLPRNYNWIPGDFSGDGVRGGGDVTYGVRYLKGLGTPPPDSVYLDTTCDFTDNGTRLYFRSDVNGDCNFSGADITRLVAFFKGTGVIVPCRYTRPRATKNVFDADINAGDTVIWSADTTYILPISYSSNQPRFSISNPAQSLKVFPARLPMPKL